MNATFQHALAATALTAAALFYSACDLSPAFHNQSGAAAPAAGSRLSAPSTTAATASISASPPAAALPAPTRAVPAPVVAIAAGKPTLFLIGDSTVNNTANGALGWGAPFIKMFDPAKITVKNTAIAGRSARSFYSEGRWDGPNGIKNQLKPGDYVLMEMGHNDGGNVAGGAAAKGRPDLPGLGDETATGVSSAGKDETVHTYGWYMKLYVNDTKAKGATPVMLTMIPHNRWNANTLVRNEVNTYIKWSHQIADEQNLFYIDVNQISATRLEADKAAGADITSKYYSPPGDGTHTNPTGAAFNAESVVMGIRALQGLKLNDYLTEDAKKQAAADPKNVQSPHFKN